VAVREYRRWGPPEEFAHLLAGDDEEDEVEPTQGEDEPTYDSDTFDDESMEAEA
jgi:hypothetical protein